MLTVDSEQRITMSQVRNHQWTQMRFNGLIDTIKSQKKISSKQIENALIFNLTRKKPKKSESNHLSSEDEPLSIDLKCKHTKFKHSKSLDRELAIYLQSKSRMNAKPQSNQKQSAINTLKQKLKNLKMTNRRRKKKNVIMTLTPTKRKNKNLK